MSTRWQEGLYSILNKEKTRLLLALLYGLVSVALIAFLYSTHRNGEMDRLYAEAAGYAPFTRGSAQSVDAVKKLATYRGQRPTEILLRIATGQGPGIWTDTQVEAIKALQSRRNSRTGDALGSLLQPYQGLEIRRAASGALKTVPCKGECIRSTLHYLERVQRGEPNFEDKLVLPPGSERLVARSKSGQQSVYDNLYEVLSREKADTLSILRSVYGLGSNDPSLFALDLVARLRLREACPLLKQSEKSIRSFPPERLNAPRQELQAAISSLMCQ
jgi:hypothetical protein